MVILDTDHLTILERGGSEEASRLRRHLSSLSSEQVATTIISYEEQTRGWMAYMAKSRTMAQQVEAYRRLQQHLENFRFIPVLPFDESAADIVEQLRRERIRIGTMDLKIAAIALSHNAILASRNLSDFRQVPDLQAEDWTIG